MSNTYSTRYGTREVGLLIRIGSRLTHRGNSPDVLNTDLYISDLRWNTIHTFALGKHDKACRTILSLTNTNSVNTIDAKQRCLVRFLDRNSILQELWQVAPVGLHMIHRLLRDGWALGCIISYVTAFVTTDTGEQSKRDEQRRR